MDHICIGAPTLPQDMPQIIDVFYRSWLTTYPNEELGITKDDVDAFFEHRNDQSDINARAERLSDLPSNEHFLVAKDSEKIVGVCLVVIRDEFNQLQAIYQLPEYQRRGIATKLWAEAKKFFDPAKDTVVHVATYNEKAIAFYQKLGFVDTGKRFTEERHRMPVSKVLIPEMEMRSKQR